MKGVAAIFLIVISNGVFSQDWSDLNAQGLDSYHRGDYKTAAKYFLAALTVTIKLPGENSEEHSTVLTNLAFTYRAQGDYQSAQASFRKVLRIASQRYDSIHIATIEGMANLANAFLPSGEYDSCEWYLLRAQEMIYRAAQERSSHYRNNIHYFFDALINVQNSLGSLFYKKGQTDKAIAVLEQQHRFIRQTYPEIYSTLPIYQSTLNNLATYYLSSGNPTGAKLIVKEQVGVAKRNTKEPLRYLDALNNLGNIYRQSDIPDSAAFFWNYALDQIGDEKFRGTDTHISLLINLGELYLSLDRIDDALTFLVPAVKIQEKRSARNPRLYQTAMLNLAEAYYYERSYRKADSCYSELTRHLIDEVLHNFTYLSDAEKISFYRANVDILERYSWFAFEVSGTMNLAPSKDKYTNPDAVKRLFNLLLITKGLILNPGYRLRNLITTTSSEETKMKYQSWEESKYAYADLRRADSVDLVKLSVLSQQTESLEKWLRTNSAAFRKGFLTERKEWHEIQKKLAPNEAAVEMVRLSNGLVYGALILTASTKNGPVTAFIKSTPSLHLEKQFYQQYANAITHAFQDTISYNVYWQPILQAIQKQSAGISRVYFCADGIYNQININTLFNKEMNRYVLDEIDLRPVTNLKDILSSSDLQLPRNPTAVLVGRPTYAMRQSSTEMFTDLPGTEIEVDEIHRMLRKKKWQTILLKHDNAQEGIVKKLYAPQVLHLATHGFFISNDRNESFVNILLNTGVALAGAGDKIKTDDDDGVLTAFEMMNINLDNTNLVVLSACETGLGKFYSGEGVYGIQRALRSAGAKSVMMSLWKVDDRATQQLMTSFYRLWLRNLQDPGAAFRKAQQELRLSFPEPKYWGAFVFTE
jgi:CHAT domain-containing protein